MQDEGGNAAESKLGKCRNRGNARQSPRGVHRKGAQAAIANEGKRDAEIDHHRLDLAGSDIQQSWRAAFVSDMSQLETKLLLECFHRNALRRADAGSPVV